MNWLEVSLQLDDELVEPASELLGRIAPNGVVIEPFGGKLLLRAWLPQDGALDSRVERLERGLWHLSQITPFPEPRYRSIPEVDWQAAWKREFRPLPIGQRLLIQPIVPVRDRAAMASGSPTSAADTGASRSPWNDAFELLGDDGSTPPDPARLTVYLEPGMAFGTGTHPTTRHCLELLEQRIDEAERVLDLGCGSGILAIAAARLGAQTILALDLDGQAVQLARLNVEHNGLAEQVQVMAGSLAELPAQARYDLIVANIQAPVIERLLDQGLAGHLAQAGALITAGILDDQQAGIESRAGAAGLRVAEVRSTADWRTSVFERSTEAG